MQEDSSLCLILTGTIRVSEDMVFTARRDTLTRLGDYKQALAAWLSYGKVHSLVFVENSAYDLSELREIAAKLPEKRVEFLSFQCPPFDGSLGKGYGEMLCLKHCLENSELLRLSSRFLKVTGRYDLLNANEVIDMVAREKAATVVSNMFWNMTWTDSRVFGGDVSFLSQYLCPMLDELNDSAGSVFEQVLARATHRAMSDGRSWILPGIAFEVRGVSGSRGHVWMSSLWRQGKRALRQMLFARLLNTGPE